MAGINRNKIFKNIEKALRNGKYQVAIDEYQKLLSENPKDFVTMNRIGELYEKLGNYKEAFKYYKSIAEHYSKAGFTTKSIAIYVKMYKIDPKNTEVAFTLANLYHKAGYDVEARKIYIDLAEYLNTQKRFGDVLSVYEKLSELDYDNTSILLKLAELYEKQGKNKESGEMYIRVGDIFKRNKDIDKAILYYKEGFSKIPNLYTLNSLIDILKENNRVNEVIGLLIDVIDKNPKDKGFKKALAKIYLEQANYDEAEKILLEIAETGEEIDEELYETLAKIYVEKGDLTKSFQVIEPVVDQLLELNKGNKAQELLNILLMKDSSFLPALWKKANIFKRLEQKSSYSLTLLSIAEVYKKRKDYERVRKIYNELVQLEPSNETYRFELEKIDELIEGEGVVTDEAEDIDKSGEETLVKNIDQFEKIFDGGFKDDAIREIENIGSLYPNNPKIKEKLLDFCMRAEYYDKALRVGKDLIDIYEKLGRKDKIDDIARKLILQFPDDPVINSYITASETDINIPFEDEDDSQISFRDNTKSLDEYISQINFFIQENFAEDAVKLVEEALDNYPNNPKLLTLQQSARLLLNTKVTHPDQESFEQYDEDTAELEIYDEKKQDDSVSVEESPKKEDGESVKEEGEDDFEVEMELEIDDISIEEDKNDFQNKIDSGKEKEEIKEENIELEEINPMEEIDENIELENISPMEEIDKQKEKKNEKEIKEDDFKELDLNLSEESLDEVLNMTLGETDDSSRNEDETDSSFSSLEIEQDGFEDMDDIFEGEEVFDMPESYYYEVGTIVSQEIKAINEISNKARDNVTSTIEKDFDDILDQFKKQLDVTVKKEDFETRYNLGIAYFGMGLYDEAINEFLISSKDDKLRFDSYVHLGYSFSKKGLFKEAEEWFKKVLSMEGISEDKIISIKYELANIYEINGNNNEAIKLYKEIEATEPDYRDVKNRLKKLLY